MRGKACSAEFMRRLEKMVSAHEGKHKDLVKFIAGQTCLDPHTIRQLVRSFELKAKMSVTGRFTEEMQPTVLIEALAAPNPEELVIQAIEEDWTADQTRQEAKRLKHVEIHKTIPPSVSYRFPQKFPNFLQGFLNSMRELTPRIQETFRAKPASILSVKGFLGGKLFHGQETFGFLEGFLGGGVSSRLQVTSICQ